MEPILLSTNESKAQAFINELESKYLPALNEVIAEVKAMKLPALTKDELIEIIQGNFVKLNEKYWSLAKDDIDAFKTQAARESIVSTITQRFEYFISHTKIVFSADVENRKLNDSYFFQYFEIDESGNAVMTELIQDQIYESFKEYLTGIKAARVYKKQLEAAESLQDLWDALDASKMNRGIANPWVLFISLFDIKITEENKIEIVSRKLNYNVNNEVS